LKSYIIQFLFSVLPDTRLYRFKAFLLRLRGFQIGDNVRVVSSVKLKLKYLSVEDNSFIGHETLIAGGDALVQIGQNVGIAPRCVIITGTHEIGDSTNRAGEGKSESIIIGDGTWIGAHSTILGGVCIGHGCVIAAGSLVCEDIDDNRLVAGVPAKVIRKLP
jgi:acetyltransferase-like isoleucine patch superfamily enzyme